MNEWNSKQGGSRFGPSGIGRRRWFVAAWTVVTVGAATSLVAGRSEAQSSTAVPSAPATGVSPVDLRAGAWDQSVRLEKQGAVKEARDLMWRAWGTDPDSYEVTVRLAWLSLRLDDLDNAQHYYERARRMEGAGPEATEGLASTWARRGFIALDAGDKSEARRCFEQALSLRPEHAEAQRGMRLVGPASFVVPEVWAGYLDMAMEGQDWYALSVFGRLTFQWKDHYRLFGAYRREAGEVDLTPLPPPGRPDLRPPARTMSFSQDEFYLGGGLRYPWFDVDLMGLAVLPDRSEGKILGGAGRLRVGRKLGVLGEAALLRLTQKRNNTQLDPAVYWWPVDWLGLAAGVRFTLDDVDDSASYHAGMTLFPGKGHRIDAEAFVGPRRLPLSMDGVSLVNIYQELETGGAATWQFDVGKGWRAGVQGSLSRVRVTWPKRIDGTYGGLALGVWWKSL